MGFDEFAGVHFILGVELTAGPADEAAILFLHAAAVWYPLLRPVDRGL